jgi:uncharacterized protein (DUF1778 family)
MMRKQAGGRPRRAEEEAASEKLTQRYTPSERRLIRKAKGQGTESEFIRAAALEKAGGK